MKHYEKLLKKACFSREELIGIVGTPAAAKMVIYEYQKKGFIERVKRDFYVVISIETKQPVLSRYQIGWININPSVLINIIKGCTVHNIISFYACVIRSIIRSKSSFE